MGLSALTAKLAGTLFICTLIMGCAEVMIIGVLDLAATDLQASLPEAGGLVTANALGIAIGGPTLTFAAVRLDRRTMLYAPLGLFAVLNIPAALGLAIEILIPMRFLAGSVQGLFIATAVTTLTRAVPEEQVGKAIAIVISGFAVSGAIGMPIGSWIGATFGWQITFGVVVGASLIALPLVLMVVPAGKSQSAPHRRTQIKHALSGPVVAVLLIAVLVFAGTQSAVTYVVPFLKDQAGASAALVGILLLVYGVSAAVGSVFGGIGADKHSSATLLAGTIGVSLSLATLYLFSTVQLVVAIGLALLGFSTLAITAPLQLRVEVLAGPGAPLAASLPASAANFGDAMGAFSGGQAIAHYGVAQTMAVGFVIALAALAVAASSLRVKPKEASEHK